MPARRRSLDLVEGLPQTRRALAYAERLHEGQRRQADGAPFILHPIEVASLLYDAGATDDVIAAGVLHDVIEKAGVRAAQLRRRFGARITSLVLAVTDDHTVSDYQDRKSALRTQVAGAGDDALIVFAADKISKVRELALEHPATGSQRRPGASRERRIAHYHECLVILEAHLPDAPLVAQLRSEFETVRGAAGGDRVLATGLC